MCIYVIIQLLDFLIELMRLRAKRIYSCVTGNIEHPGKQTPLLCVIFIYSAPDLQEYFLQAITGSIFFIEDFKNNSVESWRIVIIQVPENLLVTVPEALYQFLFSICICSSQKILIRK